MLKILTEAGGVVGLGHLGRCLPILAAARSKGIDAKLIAHPFGAFDATESGIELVPWLTDPERAGIADSDIVILDSLRVEPRIFYLLKKRSRRVLAIDDIGNPLFNEEIRIDWSVRSFLNRAQQSKGLVSPKYVPLRPAFTGFPPKDISSKVERVLVTFGGSDIRGLSHPVCELISRVCSFSEIVVFATTAFRDLRRLRNLSDGGKIILLEDPGDIEMRAAMLSCDLAIASGGHSIFELAAAGLPTVHLLVVDNQAVSEDWKYTGFTKFVGWHSDWNLLEKLCEAVAAFGPVAVREAASRAGQELVGGCGASSIIDWIENELGF